MRSRLPCRCSLQVTGQTVRQRLQAATRSTSPCGSTATSWRRGGVLLFPKIVTPDRTIASPLPTITPRESVAQQASDTQTARSSTEAAPHASLASPGSTAINNWRDAAPGGRPGRAAGSTATGAAGRWEALAPVVRHLCGAATCQRTWHRGVWQEQRSSYRGGAGVLRAQLHFPVTSGRSVHGISAAPHPPAPLQSPSSLRTNTLPLTSFPRRWSLSLLPRTRWGPSCKQRTSASLRRLPRTLWCSASQAGCGVQRWERIIRCVTKGPGCHPVGLPACPL